MMIRMIILIMFLIIIMVMMNYLDHLNRHELVLVQTPPDDDFDEYDDHEDDPGGRHGDAAGDVPHPPLLGKLQVSNCPCIHKRKNISY